MPLLPSVVTDAWDAPQDHRVFDSRGNTVDDSGHDGYDENTEVEDIMTEALRWSESPSADVRRSLYELEAVLTSH